MNEDTTPVGNRPRSSETSSMSSSGGATVAETTRTEVPAESTGVEANEMTQQARERMSEAGRRVRGEAERAADALRHRAAEEVRVFGSTMNAAADQLDDKEHDRVGAYAHGINSTCESVADYIESADLSEVADGVSERARRNPAMFLGAAAIAGLALGRLLSATPPRSKHERHESPSPGAGNSPRPGGSNVTTREPRLKPTTSGVIPTSAEPRHTPSPPSRSNEGTSHDHRCPAALTHAPKRPRDVPRHARTAQHGPSEPRAPRRRRALALWSPP